MPDTSHIKAFDKQQNTLWQTLLLIPTRMTSFQAKGLNPDHTGTSKITTWGGGPFHDMAILLYKAIHLFLGWHKAKRG